MSKSNRFCFTLNNYTDIEYSILTQDLILNTVKYIIVGKEVGEQGTPHLQGYFEFENNQKQRITAAKAKLTHVGISDSIHLEIAKGTAQQNIAYCSKGGNFVELGQRPKGQGKRTDLDNAVDAIRNGSSISDLITDHGSQIVKYGKGLLLLQQMQQPKRFFKTEVYWLWGPPGSGKSRYAWETAPDAYAKNCSNKWWDGYENQEVVIMDDFRPSKEIPFSFILNLFDRYPLTVEVKGGMCTFNSKKIYVTTPMSPVQMCNQLDWIGDEKKEQLLRRIEHQIQFPQLAVMYLPKENKLT